MMDSQNLPSRKCGRPAPCEKLVIIMVGLPARGKSFIVRKMARYLNWLQQPTRIFNAGERRRQTALRQPENESLSSAAFFDPGNQANVSRRDEIVLCVLDELVDWIIQDGKSVGILDATNSTKERRQLVIRRIEERAGFLLPVLFLESRCFDDAVLDRNFRLKLSGPDYCTQDPRTALEDFERRVCLYEQTYATLGPFEEEAGLSYVQVTDVGRKMTTHMIRGLLSTQVVEYMLGFNLTDRQLWITCGGESEDDIVGRIGRRSSLSHAGTQYATDLSCLIHAQRASWDSRFPKDGLKRGLPFSIWTSTMPQATQTSDAFSDDLYRKSEIKLLDDINAGDMSGLTFGEIAASHPDVYAARKQQRLVYRWPGLGGEAYSDVIFRLKPIIVELERLEEHMLVVSHRAVVRVLLAYFLDLQRGDLPELSMPKDCVFLIEPKPYGNEFYAFQHDPDRHAFDKIPHPKARFLAN